MAKTEAYVTKNVCVACLALADLLDEVNPEMAKSLRVVNLRDSRDSEMHMAGFGAALEWTNANLFARGFYLTVSPGDGRLIVFRDVAGVPRRGC